MKTNSRTKPARKRGSAAHAPTRKRTAAALHKHRAAYPVHKRLLMHPLSTFALLLCGVLIVGWTYRVIAATTISAVVEAPPLTGAAVLATPAAQAHFTDSAITVTGSCPPQSYVKLSVNGAFGGVGWCDTTNSFTIHTSLYAGHNTLTPQAYNITDLAGPASQSIDVYYTPPQPAATATGTNQATTPPAPASHSAANPSSNASESQNVTPLMLSSDFQFRTFSVVKKFSWVVDLEGGTPPYKVTVNWGDGANSHYDFATDPAFTVTHTYKKPGYYAVTLNSVDNTGSQKVMQLAALITTASGQAPFLSSTGSNNTSGPGAASIVKPANSLTSTAKWLLLAWPAYLVVVLMTLSFWLGERREFITLKVRH